MEKIRIYEVTPRDGLQNEKKILSLSDKIELIGMLGKCGYKDIEITSFVKPSWIPQLADSDELTRMLPPPPEGVRYWALIPNRRGLERALEAGAGHIATFMSASESHNRKNLNRTRLESLSNLRDVIGVAKDEGVSVRSYLSTVFGCPFEGAVKTEESLRLASELLAMGADEIVLGDTTGMGNPKQVREVVRAMVNGGIPLEVLSLHMHDTKGTALANVYAGYLEGIRSFDGSTAGVGGCPYAPGAAGNVASEDLANFFSQMNCETGIDLDAAAETGLFLSKLLDRELPGRYYRYHQGAKERKRRSA